MFFIAAAFLVLVTSFVVVMLVVEMLRDPSFMLLVLTVVFGCGLLITIACFLWVQSMLFPWKACIKADEYRISSGVVRFRKRLTPEARLVFVQAYSHGDYGYGIMVDAGMKFRLILQPGVIVGSRAESRKAVERIADWVRASDLGLEIVNELPGRKDGGEENHAP